MVVSEVKKDISNSLKTFKLNKDPGHHKEDIETKDLIIEISLIEVAGIRTIVIKNTIMIEGHPSKGKENILQERSESLKISQRNPKRR